MGDTRPMYQRIADDLRRQIDEGGLAVGARIPSRAELKRAYRASDQTVDRAVRVLKTAGYAIGQFGRGVFVSDRAPIGALVRTTDAVDTPLAARISVPGATAVNGQPDLVWEATSTRTVAPPGIAERLRVRQGERVMCTQYEYLADRRPLQLATSWEPLSLTEGTDVMFPERGPYARRGVRGRFAAIGIQVAQAREVVGSRPATSPEAEALGCAPGQCVTAVERTHYDVGDRPVETSDTVVLGDRWRLEYAITFGT
ncbi:MULTISPECIES: GntR family transcriptional regulator [unclassified Streptomyces]|uniref:GntR family transcriptional regulator n=1 Tax=Streptomyces johnsoniae TaxID=3075532 RepID=A0ABU2S0H0_9ACTN|nr:MULTISPECIES: GntR family transcriptional regulator [unclassified Streptomyces]MDT0442278.1 GntR family transcriptional regulator [Streptomyces sp. DSM 41886]ONK10333.1 HTH-type transcriptional regulator FrlR [Streptomyces sp. MP131-18]